MQELELLLLNYDNLFDINEKYNAMPTDSGSVRKDSSHLTGEQRTTQELVHLREQNLKLKLENQRLLQKTLKLRKQNRKMEIRQKAILGKIQSLRSIQMESNLAKKWTSELDDLDVITEDDELFLETLADSQVKLPIKLFNLSGNSKENERNQANGSTFEIQMESLLSPLKHRIQTFDYNAFDKSALQSIRKSVSSAANPMEEAAVLIKFLEERVRGLKKELATAVGENGGSGDRITGRSDQGEAQTEGGGFRGVGREGKREE